MEEKALAVTKNTTVKECIPYDDTWLKDLLKKIEDFEIPSLVIEPLLTCNILSGNSASGYKGMAKNLLEFYMHELDNLIKKDNTISASEVNDLRLKAIDKALDAAIKLEVERVNIANKGKEIEIAVALQQLKIYETIADVRMKLELFLIERDIAYAKLLSMKADYLLKKTQAISFVFNQRAKLTDILFNMVIVGATQEIMHVLKEINTVCLDLVPNERFKEAWMGDEYLTELDDLVWEGICQPKACQCDLCKG